MNESDTGAVTTETEQVECRPGTLAFLMGLLLMVMSVGISCIGFTPLKSGEPRSASDWLFLAGISLVGVGYSAAVLLHWLRFRVIADSTGLRWRGTWSGWRSATWAQVTDYYTDRHSLQRQSMSDVTTVHLPMPVIVTENGTIRTADKLQSSILPGLDDLKRAVQTRATSARVDPARRRVSANLPLLEARRRQAIRVAHDGKCAVFRFLRGRLGVGCSFRCP